ncbi:MAG: hypothetical protein FWD21_03070, partial [Peptococcaceae bacterium]|nr:hypothetical protein [Peptococcaceae bacterium]
RFRDLYLDNQWREVASSVGYWNGMVNTLKKVEILVQEPDPDYQYGTQALISDFFNVWSELNHYRHDLGVKEAVIQAAAAMTNAFRQTYAQIDNVRENTNKMINNTIDRINEVSKQITILNKEIDRVMRVGQNPNDLLDKRDLLLDELSSYGVMTQRVIPVPASAITEDALQKAPNPDHPGFIEVTFFGKVIVTADNDYVAITREEVDAWAGIYNEENMTIINALITRIGALNDQIDAQFLSDPDDPSFQILLNRREDLLDRLRDFGAVTVNNLDSNPDNIGYYQIEVSFYSKQVIEAGNVVNTLDPSDPSITWIAAKPESGQLLGYLDGLKKIDKYLGQYDELAQAITDEVNLLHTTGSAEVVAGTALNIGPVGNTEGKAVIADNGELVLHLENGKTYTVVFSNVKNNSDVIDQINKVLGQDGRAFMDKGNLVIRSYGGVSTEIAVDTAASDPAVLAALGLVGPEAVLSDKSDSGHPVFFVVTDALGSGKTGSPYFFVNPYIVDNPQLVNSEVSMDIFDLRNQGTMVDGTARFEDFYNAIVTGIGADVKAAQDRLAIQAAVMLQVDNMRESLIGVNEDEELTLMLQFNRSYQASSRMITVMDGLLDVLINRTAV